MNAPKTLADAMKTANAEFAANPMIASVVITLECGLAVSIDRAGRITQA